MRAQTCTVHGAGRMPQHPPTATLKLPSSVAGQGLRAVWARVMCLCAWVLGAAGGCAACCAARRQHGHDSPCQVLSNTAKGEKGVAAHAGSTHFDTHNSVCMQPKQAWGSALESYRPAVRRTVWGAACSCACWPREWWFVLAFTTERK